MQPYQFVAGTESLTQQPSGTWVASFEAYIYDGQTYVELSNSIDPGTDHRIIEFDVVGDELPPLSNQAGASAPYTRGTENGVELVLTKDGKRHGNITVYYP